MAFCKSASKELEPAKSKVSCAAVVPYCSCLVPELRARIGFVGVGKQATCPNDVLSHDGLPELKRHI